MIKYLYGKKLYLKPIAEGEVGFRFSDLAHYARLENELMRDQEMDKIFTMDKFSVELRINDCVIKPEDMASDPKFTFPAMHCFCLCLSNRKNSEELFSKFDADICIEVKVDLLLEFLNDFFSKRFVGMAVKARDIIYYGPNYFPKGLSESDLVFYKPESFKHEDEFRIALFYPQEKLGFKSENGDIFPFKNEADPAHVTISYPDKTFLKHFIGDVFER